MTTYQCKMCGFIFDEEKENMNSEEEITFENLDPKWECPDCGTLKKDEDMWEEYEDEEEEEDKYDEDDEDD